MAAKASSSRTLQDFRAAHDRNVIIPAKIKAALSGMLEEGAENWAYEAELIRRAQISQTDLGLFRDHFAEHVVETGGKSSKRVWFADPKVAQKVRKT